MSELDTDLVKRGSISEIVQSYESALAKIETAYGILSEAQDELKSAFSCGGKFDTDFGVLPDRNHVTQNADAGSLKEVKEVIKLESGELPEITIESVFEIFEALNQNMNTFANESVLEVYKWLRPATDGWEMSKYKTNQKNATFELGKKVVKSRMVENKYSGAGFHVNHYNEKYLLALDKVFHMLDGKSMMQSYRSPLVDAINTSEGGEVVTEYFKVKMYRNCNAHIEFLRQNLVDEFNKICGGMNLKPFNS
jgi:hypothetical protein